MLYLSLFCLNLSYKSLDVYNSGGGVVPNSDVYKYSDPLYNTVSIIRTGSGPRSMRRRQVPPALPPGLFHSVSVSRFSRSGAHYVMIAEEGRGVR